MTITKPGLYDLTEAEYHADPCPEVSLSSSGIRTLLNETPAHFKARNPRLTDFPDHCDTPTKEQDLGTLIHALVLEKGQAIEVCNFDDWRTKAAQAQREAARAAGHLPVLAHVYEQAQTVAMRAREALEKRYGGWPIGESEVAMVWQRQTSHGPIWCRALMDHWSKRAVTILDLKTTGSSLADDKLRKKIADEGGDIQDAFYREGISTLFPQFAGLVQFTRVYVEVEPPHSTRPITLRESWLTRARHRIDRAAEKFAFCLQTGTWDAWPTDTQLDAPGYLETKWEAEELEAV